MTLSLEQLQQELKQLRQEIVIEPGRLGLRAATLERLFGATVVRPLLGAAPALEILYDKPTADSVSRFEVRGKAAAVSRLHLPDQTEVSACFETVVAGEPGVCA